MACQRTVRDGRVDLRQILQHHSPGADVHVADFGIAHLPVGETYGMLGGIEQAPGIGFGKRVEIGRSRLKNGVMRRIGAVLHMPPAVENGKKHGFGAFLERIVHGQ